MRLGNNPKRRIELASRVSVQEREELAGRLIYVGSAHHKTKPGDYGFRPPVSPRPSKSICDGIRIIPLKEARELFRRGIINGMFSRVSEGMPKYVWSVGEDGQVYEAKIGNGGYHGYRLEDEDEMRAIVKREWVKRC